MMIFILGGSGSGKSLFAEEAARKNGAPLYYVATMRPYGEEAQQRIARHRKQRTQKGFTTVECYTRPDLLCWNGTETVLLECMSNLLLNEMTENENFSETEFLQQIAALERKVKTLYLVSNDISSDGCVYDAFTERYRKIMGNVNRALALTAAEVVEVVFGIPVRKNKQGEI